MLIDPANAEATSDVFSDTHGLLSNLLLPELETACSLTARVQRRTILDGL